MLNLVERDLNKNNKNANTEGKVHVAPSAVIPVINEDLQKMNLNQENKNENKKNKNDKDKESKVATNNEKSNL